ncbi:MAG: GyrI-like domain-containing protein [Plesiomonas sp.]|uniref:GyrI-like domain-containing protein n=1 Tax=Plesiomonas sp. TaxID=2486279 RepID=UPI003F3B0163
MLVQLAFRIEYGNEMFLVGTRQKHTLAQLPKDIPTQWREFKKTFEKLCERSALYGVICSADENVIEYMCGVEVSPLQFASEYVGKIIIPQQKYAVFLHRGHISAIGASWDDILQ